MAEKIYSKKGREMSKLMRLKTVLEDPRVYRGKGSTEQMTIRVPQDLAWTIDKISKHLHTTKTEVVIMLLDAVVTEVAVESSEKLGRLLGDPISVVKRKEA